MKKLLFIMVVATFVLVGGTSIASACPAHKEGKVCTKCAESDKKPCMKDKEGKQKPCAKKAGEEKKPCKKCKESEGHSQKSKIFFNE